MSWTCPNDDNDFCKKLKKPCSTAQKGCVLEGKVSRAIDDEDAVDQENKSTENPAPPKKRKRRKDVK